MFVSITSVALFRLQFEFPEVECAVELRNIVLSK